MTEVSEYLRVAPQYGGFNLLTRVATPENQNSFTIKWKVKLYVARENEFTCKKGTITREKKETLASTREGRSGLGVCDRRHKATMFVLGYPVIRDHLPKEFNQNQTYATCTTAPNSGTNRRINSPSIFRQPVFPNTSFFLLINLTLASTSRRTRVMMADATLTKFPTCPTNYMRDPIADPKAGHMSYI